MSVQTSDNPYSIQSARPKRLLSVHWTLHPEKSEGVYVVEKGGSRRPVTPPEAYALFLEGREVSSPWRDAEVERRLGDGIPLQVIRQEIDLNYMESGNMIFPAEAVRAGLDRARKPVFKREVDIEAFPKARRMINVPDGRIWVWKPPVRGRAYSLFGDPSESQSDRSDHAGFAVTDCVTRDVVCTGAGWWPPHVFAPVLAVVGYWYNEALLAVEKNTTCGGAVLTTLAGRLIVTDEDLKDKALKATWKYRRLYVDYSRDTERMNRTHKLGWRTGKQSKREIVTILCARMGRSVEWCPDWRFWDQCEGFIEMDDGSVGNPDGDDLVIAVGGSQAIAPEAARFSPLSSDRPADPKNVWREFYRKVAQMGEEEAQEWVSQLLTRVGAGSPEEKDRTYDDD